MGKHYEFIILAPSLAVLTSLASNAIKLARTANNRCRIKEATGVLCENDKSAKERGSSCVVLENHVIEEQMFCEGLKMAT